MQAFLHVTGVCTGLGTSTYLQLFVHISCKSKFALDLGHWLCGHCSLSTSATSFLLATNRERNVTLHTEQKPRYQICLNPSTILGLSVALDLIAHDDTCLEEESTVLARMEDYVIDDTFSGAASGHGTVHTSMA